MTTLPPSDSLNTATISTRELPDTFALRFTVRDFIVAFLIILIAFSYRTVIIVDRAFSPQAGAYDPLLTGGDQGVYYGSIEAYKTGAFPPDSPFYFQPGMSWFMIAISRLVGSSDLTVLRLVVAALASINCALIIAVVRLAFERRSMAYLAGLLMAIYPVGAFYDTDFVITSEATILITLMLLGSLWLWRRPKNWIGVILLGFSLGAAYITRFEIMVVGVALGIWLLAVGRDGTKLNLLRVGQLLTALGVAIVVVMPTFLHNLHYGASYVTPASAMEIYRGNNRDSNGSHEDNQADATTGFDYYYFLAQDILLSPARFAGLVLHKIGVYLSAQEPGNNLNYLLSGKEIVPMLAINPLDFRILAILFMLGLITTAYQRDRATLPFVIVASVMMIMTLAIWVEARIRTPAIAGMIPLATYGLVHAVQRIGGMLRERQPVDSILRVPRRLILWTALAGGLLIAARIGETSLPLPYTVDHLPADANVSSAVYDGRLKLLGWKVEEQYTQAGLIQPFRPYVVSLYWQLIAPADVDFYSFSLAFFVDGKALTSYDHPVGSVAYPHLTTADWEIGKIYVDHVGLTLRTFNAATLESGNLLLTVYPGRNAEQVFPAEMNNTSIRTVELARPAFLWGQGQLTSLTPRADSISFGDVLKLVAWSMPSSAGKGQPIEIHLGWQTTAIPIRRSYALGVYAFDATGQFVAQADSPPRQGKLLTTSLPVNYLLEDVKQLKLPDTAGTYTVYVGVYDLATMDRLPVPGGSNNLAKIGDVTLQ